VQRSRKAPGLSHPLRGRADILSFAAGDGVFPHPSGGRKQNPVDPVDPVEMIIGLSDNDFTQHRPPYFVIFSLRREPCAVRRFSTLGTFLMGLTRRDKGNKL
jgi:hypothetical protein